MPMYSYKVGQLLTKEGRIDRRKSIKINLDDIDTKDIENKVYKRVMKRMDTTPEPTEAPERIEKKKHKSWLTSTMGTTMIATNIVSSAFSLANAYNSTDTALQAKTSYSSVKGIAMTGIGLIPIWGPVLTTLLGMVDGIIGDKITNEMQLRYDNSRLQYNMSRNDIGRYSTKIYDYEKQTWIARDVETANNQILNQNSSV